MAENNTVRLTGEAALDALEAANVGASAKAELHGAYVSETDTDLIITIPKRIAPGALKMSTTGKSLVVTARTDSGANFKTVRHNGTERVLPAKPFNINLTFPL